MREPVSERMYQIMKAYGLSPSLFADKIGVVRASISHIMSGRNRPSLDMIAKTLSTFQELDPMWLIAGEGQMKKTVHDHQTHDANEKVNSVKSVQNPPTGSVKTAPPQNEPTILEENQKVTATDKKVEKIIFFYDDRSFEIFRADEGM